MLDFLEVSNAVLMPEFNSNIFEYEVEVDSSTSFLDIKYESSFPVTIYGNEDLKEGVNHILIEVYNEKVYTYVIKVNKEKTQSVFSIADSKKVLDNYSPIALPLISASCFLLILVIFCIIFRKK